MLKKVPLWATAVAGALFFAASPFAQELLLTADLPVKPGAITCTPNQVLKRDYAGNYTIFFDGAAAGIPANVHITAITTLGMGLLIFAADVPFSAGGNTYLPSDVVLYSGGVFSMWQSGAALSLPPDAVIDALALDQSSNVYYSFDAPVKAGTNVFLPGDVARVSGNTLSPFLSGASDLGLPPGGDVVGFQIAPNGDYLFMLRTPATLGGTTFLPGQIARRSGGVWDLYWSPGGGVNNVVTTFALPASPGSTPDGGTVAGTPFTMTKSGTNAHLAWGAACVSDANDYAIYRGTLGSWYSHSSVVCTTGGATSADVAYGGGNEYYLVVPLNGTIEGSYGKNSSGAQIPQAAAPCRAYYEPGSCP